MRIQKATSKKDTYKDVALLLDESTILLENCRTFDYERTLTGTKTFSRATTINEIWKRGKTGEVLKHDSTIKKWRKECPESYSSRTVWRNHPQEVTLLSHKNLPDKDVDLIKSITDWRNWVDDYGGSISGTMASTSWSIFRNSIPRTWITPYKSFEPITRPIGGRILPCKQLWSEFSGSFIQWDLYASYSRILAGLRYGGDGSRWKEINPNLKCFDRMAEDGWLIYIEADVEIPEMELGPLPKRRKNNSRKFEYNIAFPVGQTLSGIWTHEEIRMAERVGCGIKKRRAYVHFATGQKYHFKNWYKAIQDGRDNLSGFGRGLVKETGNALWGRFAMRPRPSRTVWWNHNQRRDWTAHKEILFSNQSAPELADQLCGKIRADLYEIALSAGNDLMLGNTDGIWTRYREGWRPPHDNWIKKTEAYRLKIMDDWTYEYWEPESEEGILIYPGLNMEYQRQIWDERWRRRNETKVH